MALDYDVAARLLRVYDAVAEYGVAHLQDLCAAAGLAPTQVTETVFQMTQRFWLTTEDGMVRYSVPASMRPHLGKNPGQLLALDIAAWVSKSKAKALKFPDEELPEHIRTASRDLIVVALRDLEQHRAVRLSHALGGHLYASVLPAMSVYEFGPGKTSPSVHVGDVVGGNKNTVTGSGVIVDGSNNVVVAGSAVSGESLRALIAELRNDQKIDSDALDRLELATTRGISEDVVAEHATQAVTMEPRLLTRLVKWFSGQAAAVRNEAVATGVRLLLESSGAIPPGGP